MCGFTTTVFRLGDKICMKRPSELDCSVFGCVWHLVERSLSVIVNQYCEKTRSVIPLIRGECLTIEWRPVSLVIRNGGLVEWEREWQVRRMALHLIWNAKHTHTHSPTILHMNILTEGSWLHIKVSVHLDIYCVVHAPEWHTPRSPEKPMKKKITLAQLFCRSARAALTFNVTSITRTRGCGDGLVWLW